VLRRALVTVSLLGLALLLASSALSQAQQTSSTKGSVSITIKGWGKVRLGKGFLHPRNAIRCMQASCPASLSRTKSFRATATAVAAKGWRFAGWRGACLTKKKAKCVIDLKHVRGATGGYHHAWATARFVAREPGFTSSDPVPIGHVGVTGDRLRLNVNSATPNVALSPAPPSAAEYFVANVTVTNLGAGAVDTSAIADGRLAAVGVHNSSYTVYFDLCPNHGPGPLLDGFGLLFSGQTATGNVCWTVAAKDQSSLEMYYPGTYQTWFALH
jgi:hypothetical protein